MDHIPSLELAAILGRRYIVESQIFTLISGSPRLESKRRDLDGDLGEVGLYKDHIALPDETIRVDQYLTKADGGIDVIFSEAERFATLFQAAGLVLMVHSEHGHVTYGLRQ
ncbi:MAG: hypothetical protein AAGA25_11835 [Planctomycetota bacterium]